MKKQLIILFLLIPILFISCENSPPIEQKKLIKIYSEMLFIQDSTSLSQSEIKDLTLKKFKVSGDDYDNTISFYNQNPEKWQAFFDSVIVYIEEKNPKPIKPDSKTLPKRSVTLDKKIEMVKKP